MKRFQKKWKLAVASMLAVCCVGTAVGAALTANPVAAADGEMWNGMGGEVIGDVTVASAAISVRNNVDITKLPNSTGVFYMYYTDSSPSWSGFSFRNGNDGCGYAWNLSGEATTSPDKFPWHALGYEAENHMIFHDSRNFGSGGTLGGVEGTEGAKFMSGMVPVEIHIGKGTAQNDPSYIKVGGYDLKQEDVATTSITQPWTRATGTSKELVASMFPQGCYVTVNHNFGDAATHSIALSDVGSVVGLNASMDMTSAQQAGEFSKALTLDLSAQGAFGEGYAVTASVNGHALATDAVTVTKTDDNSASVSISAEKLNAIQTDWLSSTTYFQFDVKNGTTDYGSAVVATKITFEEPADFENTEVTLTEKTAISYTFTYDGSVDPVQDATLSYRYAPALNPIDLKKDTDFTVTKEAEQQNKYKLEITKECVERLFNGHTAVTFLAKIGPGDSILLSAVFDGQTTKYGVRFREGIDYLEGTLKEDEYYSSATIRRLTPKDLASRVFYENAVSVTEPITIEYSNLPVGVEWMLISVMNNPKISEYFDENTSPELGNTFSMVMFGKKDGKDRHDLQGFHDSLQSGGTPNNNTVGYKENTYNKNNIVEICFGAENADDGYVRINGFELTLKPNRTQKDFPDGKAYVGFFFNNQNNFDFTLNTHLNAVAITEPQADSDYAMDLGKAKDFTVSLINTSGKLKLKDEKGIEIPTGQYAYAEGKLTIKAEYFSKRAYSNRGQILIWDEEKKTGTGFWMDFTNSAMEPAHIEYLTKGAIKDVTFDLGITELGYALAANEAMPSENYELKDGKFTVKAAAIADTVGLQEFIIGGTDGKVYPCYIYVNEWENGIAKKGEGTLSGDEQSGYTLSGKVSFDQMKSYNLSEGVTFGVEFATIDGYNENNINKNPHTVLVIKFFDPGKNYTMQFTLYPNYPDDKITTGNEALYLRYEVLREDGSAIKSYKNGVMEKTAGGNHNFTVIATDDGGVEITYAGYSYSLDKSALDGFNTANCVLTVDALESTDGSVAKVTLQSGVHADEMYKGDGGNQPDDQGGSGTEEGCGGCGGVIFGNGFMIAGLLLGAALVAVLCRKKD